MDIKRIALIIPHTDITLESDLQRGLPNNYIIHTQRIFLKEVSEDAEKEMVDIELPLSIKYLKGITKYSAAVFGCTSASAVYGVEGVRQIRNLLEDNFNCEAISAFEAVVRQIKKKNPRKISLISPYTANVNDFMVKSLSDNDIEVSYSNGLGILKDIETSKITTNDILKFIDKNKEKIKSNSDLCLVSCTNFRATEVIDEIRKILGMDVVTSNHSILKFILDV